MRRKRVARKRRREGKTDYKKRLELLQSRKPRLVVRVTNSRVIAQLVRYEPDGDKVESSAYSTELEDLGWTGSTKNIPAAYLTGKLIASKTDADEAVLDIGLNQPEAGGRIFAVVKGAVDGGLDVPASEHVFPSDERIEGDHLDDDHGFTTVNEKV
jgi:large subunit ribosomal protein L18